jgi:pimeloyl-ACP methyl ester carboxylesterase
MDQAERLQEFRARYPNKTLTVGGVRWQYRICGQGARPLAMLAGGLANDLAFDLVGALVSRFRIVYPAYPRVETLAEVVEGVAAILAAENLTGVSILGTSTGGAVAQYLVRRYPERVERLILSNTGIPWAPVVRRRTRITGILAAIPWPLFRAPLARSVVKVLGAPDADRPFWRAYTKELFTDRLTKADILSNLRLQIEYHGRYHFHAEDLAAWPGKIFVIESDNDPVFSPERNKALRDTYPRAPVYTFHGAGHAPAFSRSGEYLEVLTRFLE